MQRGWWYLLCPAGVCLPGLFRYFTSSAAVSGAYATNSCNGCLACGSGRCKLQSVPQGCRVTVMAHFACFTKNNLIVDVLAGSQGFQTCGLGYTAGEIKTKIWLHLVGRRSSSPHNSLAHPAPARTQQPGVEQLCAYAVISWLNAGLLL